MTLRDKRQVEFAKAYTDRMGKGILNLCPRFGKCRVGILVMQEMQLKGGNLDVLILYPNTPIMASWENEFEEMEYKPDSVTYSTFKSIDKVKSNYYDLIIIDECHLLSENQIAHVQDFLCNNILGLSGTLSYWTERDLGKKLGMDVIARYSYKQAVDEGVISDYEIRIVVTPLDSVERQTYSTKKTVQYLTEKQRFAQMSRTIDWMEDNEKPTFHMRINRMRIIQKSIAKRDVTRKILDKYKDKRVLVFCGLTEIADDLGIDSYHSKTKEKDILNRFCGGEGNHMATIKMMAQGITVKPIHIGIINYTDSNGENLAQKVSRFLNFEYDNPEKKAIIYLVSSTEEVEKKWINTALEFLDMNKVKWNYKL